MQGIKCVVVGDHKVGKTKMIVSFTKDLRRTAPTHFELHHGCVRMENGDAVELNICDTVNIAGSGYDDELRKLPYIGSDYVLMCFAINSIKSFNNVTKKWLPEVRENCPNGKIILVGTKSDKRGGKKRKKLVPQSQAKDLCVRLNAIGYSECSGSSGDGVNEVFQQIAQDLQSGSSSRSKRRSRSKKWRRSIAKIFN
mmetsp:Transcript_6778/g.7416  ORF Transcript_6778/g.7416 Transcript_6778/m.7416 type:complete len:197 (+) Transcript_6778:61-651(+)